MTDNIASDNENFSNTLLHLEIFQELKDSVNILFMSGLSLRETRRRNLVRLMGLHGLKNKDVADILRTSDGNVSAILTGKRPMGPKLIGALCAHFKIDASFFYESPDKPLQLSETERRVVERMRKRPEIATQIDVISAALEAQKSGEDRTVQEKKVHRKSA